MINRHALFCIVLMSSGCAAMITSEEAYYSPSTPDYFKIIPVHHRHMGVSILKSPEELHQFFFYWATKRKVELAGDMKFEYSFDIRSGNEKGRWSYNPAGYVQMVSYTRKPIYQIENASEFNKTLGIKN